MASSCCGGVKKQKLNNASVAGHMSSSSAYNNSNGTAANGYSNSISSGGIVVNADGSAIAVTKSGRPKVIDVEMVIYCFDVLYSYLHNTESPKAPKFTNDHFPLFVTWKLGKDRRLRGCIGTFNSTSLHQGLREYAITSAVKDSRFDPIHVDEFARLHCSVSLLTDFEVAEHYLDWEIGIHGIRIEFSTEKGSKKAATYLPEVAVEQGWSQIQTIDSLLRKGGFKGNITAEIRASVCLVRFQSEKLTVSYAEYVAHKQRPQSQYDDEIILPAAKIVISNGDEEIEFDRSIVSGNFSSSSHHHHHNNHHGHHHYRGSTSTTSSTSSGSSGGSGSSRHSTGRHRSSSNSGSREDSSNSRYMQHPYMPPPPL